MATIPIPRCPHDGLRRVDSQVLLTEGVIKSDHEELIPSTDGDHSPLSSQHFELHEPNGCCPDTGLLFRKKKKHQN